MAAQRREHRHHRRGSSNKTRSERRLRCGSAPFRFAASSHNAGFSPWAPAFLPECSGAEGLALFLADRRRIDISLRNHRRATSVAQGRRPAFAQRRSAAIAVSSTWLDDRSSRSSTSRADAGFFSGRVGDREPLVGVANGGLVMLTTARPSGNGFPGSS